MTDKKVGLWFEGESPAYRFLIDHVVRGQPAYFASDVFDAYMNDWETVLDKADSGFSDSAANAVDSLHSDLPNATPWVTALQTVTAKLASVHGKNADKLQELSGIFPSAFEKLFEDTSPAGLVLFYQLTKGIQTRLSVATQVSGILDLDGNEELARYLRLLRGDEVVSPGKTQNAQLNYLQDRLSPPPQNVPKRLPLTRKYSWERLGTRSNRTFKPTAAAWVSAVAVLVFLSAFIWRWTRPEEEAELFKEQFNLSDFQISEDMWTSVQTSKHNEKAPAENTPPSQ